jgi:uncharacterized membrane protein (UPF0127 family)
MALPVFLLRTKCGAGCKHHAMIAYRAILVALFLLVWPAAGSYADQFATETISIETSSGTQKLDVEVAGDDASRERGLMFRRVMPQNHGMIFLFGNERMITMWMRNTYLPLDMIFVKTSGIIAHIAKNTEPFSEEVISSGAPVSAVIEVNAGVADKLGIKPGDRVVSPLLTRPVR